MVAVVTRIVGVVTIVGGVNETLTGGVIGVVADVKSSVVFLEMYNVRDNVVSGIVIVGVVTKVTRVALVVGVGVTFGIDVNIDGDTEIKVVVSTLGFVSVTVGRNVPVWLTVCTVETTVRSVTFLVRIVGV